MGFSLGHFAICFSHHVLITLGETHPHVERSTVPHSSHVSLTPLGSEPSGLFCARFLGGMFFSRHPKLSNASQPNFSVFCGNSRLVCSFFSIAIFSRRNFRTYGRSLWYMLHPTTNLRFRRRHPPTFFPTLRS